MQVFDKSAYIDWLEQLDIDVLMDAAERWGKQVAEYCTMGGDDLKKLETFSQYMQREYGSSVADDGDWQYDNWKQDGIL